MVSCVCAHEIYFKYFYVGRKSPENVAIKCKEHFGPALFQRHPFSCSCSCSCSWSVGLFHSVTFTVSFQQNSILVMDFVIKYRIVIRNAAARMLVGAYFVVTKIKTITQRSSLTLFLLTRILLPLFVCSQVVFENCLHVMLFILPKLKCVRV